MSDLVKSVQEKVPVECRAKSCSAKRCSVGLSNELCPRIVIDLDSCEVLVSRNATRCDYIIISEFNGDDWVVPLELKSGKASGSKLVAQLQAGARIAEKLVPDSAKVQFRPVAACKLTKYERTVIRKVANKVKFGRKGKLIRWISCGSKLEKALLAS